MRAIEFDGQDVKLNYEYKNPELKVGEALVKVLIAGVCNTDFEIAKGYMGFNGILGHEFVGIVEEVNSEDKSLLGKRVVGEINCGCNVCEFCLKKEQIHCMNRDVLGILIREGCFADYLTLPLNNLLEVPDNVSDEEAVFVEPLAAAFEITDQVHIKPTEKVAVLGDGKLGLLIAFALKLTMAEVIVIGKHDSKLEIAKKQGLKIAKLSEIKADKSFDVVVDATGSVSGFETALSLLKPRGKFVLKSTVADDKPLNLAPIVIDEIVLYGSRCGDFKPALRALALGMIDIKPLISNIFNFDDSLNSFNPQTKGILKDLVRFN
ncbi:MAG: alcohol dehydrogenase catalytic domain-containing protein [bacterium]